MPNKQDREVLEYLQTHKSSHVRRAVQKIHASFRAASMRTTTSQGQEFPAPAAPVTPIRCNAKASTSPIKSAVKRRIEELERKIIEHSETTSTTIDFLLPLSPQSHQRISHSPRYAVSPKKLYHTLGWGNDDDDTTVSTVSISSMSMSSSLTVDRPFMEIRFERSNLTERVSPNMLGSPSSDAIRKIEHISIFDSSSDASVSSVGQIMLPTFQESPSETETTTTLSTEVEEGPEKAVFHFYVVLFALLLSTRGVDPVAILTIYLWLEIFRLHAP